MGGWRFAILAGMTLWSLPLPAFADPLAFPLDAGMARELPVLAQHGMVAAQERRAATIGTDFMKAGGNAVDAAVATAFAMAVTLPQAGNIGGGGFMLVHLAKDNKNIAIDYRELSTLATVKDEFLDANGNFDPDKSQQSVLGTGVPGTVAGMVLALQKYGSGKFSLAQILAPAIGLARDGFIVDDGLADSLKRAAKRLARYPSSARIFLHPDGTPLHSGERLVQADLAHSLEAIAQQGPDGFYKGPVADKIVAAVTAGGGHMTGADLSGYRAIERVPVSGHYRGHEIVSMPPPSSGGVHIIEILNLMEGFDLAKYGQNSAQAIHLMAESMKLAYADRSKYLGDPDFVKVPVAGLTSKKYADELRASIAMDKARPASEIAPGKPLPYESPQTTHFSVVDADGNAVSNTYTLNFFYGVGEVAEGTGILLNNELDDFAAKPGVANAFGLIGGEANAPGPRKRPLSSMSPTMMFDDKGNLELVTGSPGGSRIINIVVEIIADRVDFGLNIAESVDSPRFHDQWLPDVLLVERGMSPDTIARLEAMGHKVKVSPTFGSAQSIERLGHTLMGAADPRQRDTLAIGY
ncbi:MAG: gamma-glutamyltransferase [Hyphomicrobiales bacterium]|nr:gamma-glutamyltransferase [Hyphomicrobiales bacterium]MDE2114692.1 gamma-glutamyltransferase [Hyphomicrobiales bacterium]